MTYLLETSIAVEVLRGHKRLALRLRVLVAEGRVAVSACTAAELRYGARRRPDVEAELAHVADFLAAYEMLPFDDEAAEAYGELQADLHCRGLNLPTMDVQIAAIARAHGLTVLSRDAHFSAMPGLQVVNWLAEGSSEDPTHPSFGV